MTKKNKENKKEISLRKNGKKMGEKMIKKKMEKNGKNKWKK